MRDLRSWKVPGAGHAPGQGVRRALACLILTCVALPLAWADPARAHPFGDPQTLEVSAEGPTVRARWRADDDDLTALALALRVLKQKRTYVYRDGALVPEESDESDALVLAKSPRLGEYLARNIQVREGGTACPGRLVSAANLTQDGALLEFTCPRAVSSPQITVRTLIDLHPAYRTLAGTPAGERHTYTEKKATHTWTLDGSRANAGTSGTMLRLAIPIAVVAAAAGGVFWFRLRRGTA